MSGFLHIAQTCPNHEKRREFETCITHSQPGFPVTDNLNELLQLLAAPSEASAVLYRGHYVLLPKLMFAFIGAYGALKLSSDSDSNASQTASAAVVSPSGAASVVSQSASVAVISSSNAASAGASSSSRTC